MRQHYYDEKQSKVVFKMKTQGKDFHNFVYSGHNRNSPNTSSRSGYGSDDWFYLCEEQGQYYLLVFSDNASYGISWMFTELYLEDYAELVKANVEFWGELAYSNERAKEYSVQLLDIESIRHLLPVRSRCCGKLTDKHYRG